MTLDTLSIPPNLIHENSIRTRKRNLTHSSSPSRENEDPLETEIISDHQNAAIETEIPSFKTEIRSLKEKKITSYINYQMEKILIITIFILFLVSLWENNWILGIIILLTIFLIKPILSKIIAGWLIDISNRND